jgi:ElaB/YqjD/DUF883 family membrane-anchored ribosome-binding protein
VDAIDSRRGNAASGLDSAAAGIHASADKLGGIAHQAADGLGATAGYLRENKVGDMMADVEAYLKAHPAQALVGAAVLGFLAGRMLRRD